jgi:phage terminase large subunit-like protein
MPEDQELLVVVGVDPAVTVGNDDTGIVVVACDTNPDPYKRRAWVVDDYTMNDHVEKWAEVVLEVQKKWSEISPINPTGRPAMVVVEKDHGHDLLGVLFKNAGADLTTTPIIPISTRGMSKAQRAESVVLAYQQGRVKHDKELPGLEDEMTGWEPRNTKHSPGHIDALVHALRTLLVDPRPIARWAPILVSDEADFSYQTLAGVTPAWKREQGYKTGMAVAPWRR